MTLREATEGKEYIIQKIHTKDAELDAFLFSLGCYEGQPVAVLSRQRSGCIIALKGSRYSIDTPLSEAILV